MAQNVDEGHAALTLELQGGLDGAVLGEGEGVVFGGTADAGDGGESLGAAAGEQHYNDYMRYLTGCQYYYVDEALDVSLVTYVKP